MEVQIIDHSDKEMVRRKVKNLLSRGWKLKGEIKEFVKYIPYKVTLDKQHLSKTYYQELTLDK